MKQIKGRLRRWLGLPLRAGDSWSDDDGSTLTYLGKAPDPWDARVCAICGDPATKYETLPPWPGSGSIYCHTSMTCDAHESYLDGASWSRTLDGEWVEHPPQRGTCTFCGAPYGTCSHTAQYAAMITMQKAGAVRGEVTHG